MLTLYEDYINIITVRYNRIRTHCSFIPGLKKDSDKQSWFRIKPFNTTRIDYKKSNFLAPCHNLTKQILYDVRGLGRILAV